MKKAQALNKFWGSFSVGGRSIPAYDESTVPEESRTEYPRITYSVSEDSFGNDVLLNASIWDRNFSWIRIEEIAESIAEYIGMGGVNIHYDDGMLWIKRGTPFAQRMSDPDDSIRRILINIEAEYIGG